ncbi:type IV pilus modification PilV family protein [Fibrobacter succinogenes]|uniref:Type II secretory pathway, pseudopilin PulG n=1 Tax=Fibrobacter succinogenes TaxID=833 RepID=A0A380S7T0_FIBSU|nr:type II secretion system protein [Fibrobacter succinogenes]PWJ34950.1 type II secretory pathway pseudopilin PulG [Fibrobacter succinogenes subsp. elongatus]SUQ25073.1 Type II secretory pathway, pseudopilin PulG [Fibrobacter succinogenes]
MVKLWKNKKGFGIVEILVAAAVLGFMYMAVLNLQGGNHDALLRIRGRDGAVEVAQQVLDSLKSVGVEAIPSKALTDTSFNVQNIDRKWARGLGDSATVTYTPTVTVSATQNYTSTDASQYETIHHVYAKQVKVKVSWNFKGSTQSIEVSSVIRQ